MSYLRIRYDLVAAYGQILLAVLSFLIIAMYKQSQSCVMSSKWWMAFFYRRLLQRVVFCFYGLSILDLAAVVIAAIQSSQSLIDGSGGVSTLLVAVLTVFLFDRNEPCRLEDIFDLHTNNINVALIASFAEDIIDQKYPKIGRCVWQAFYQPG